jgi:peptidoglycan-N-acetylglucosamine deacetylase
MRRDGSLGITCRPLPTRDGATESPQSRAGLREKRGGFIVDKTGKRFPWVRVIVAVVVVVVLLLGGLYAIWQVSRSRTYQLFGELVNRVETDQPVVALTFDDGPTPRYTPGILAILAEKDVKATFFLIGNEIEANPDGARAIVAAGHEVGNHTFTHNDMTFATGDKAAEEVEKADAAIRAAGFSGEILFRPPYGKKFLGLPLYLAAHDRTTITWDVEPESEDGIAADPYRIAAHVIETTKPGSIVIMHLMYPARDTSRKALPLVIDGLREKGFRFVTVSELLALRTP